MSASGSGLLYRRTVKPALIASFGWALVVWWFGEAFGMLFMNMAAPLTGAPGAALLYAFVGVIVWPSERAAGLLDARGARMLWAGLWLAMAWLWLEAASSSANATASALKGAPSGMGWLSSVQHWVGKGAQGNGLPIAIVLALASVAIAVGVGTDRWARPLLWLAIALNLLYWVLGQGFGGIFAGGATDPNAGPLFILLAVAMFPLVGVGERAPARVREPTPHPGSPRGLSETTERVMGNAQPDDHNQGAEMRKRAYRGVVLCVIAAAAAVAMAGCGGSSSEKTEATVAFKPMAVWDASSKAKTQTTSSMKGMSAAEMKEMQSSAKAAEGMPFLPSTASGEGHFEQVGDHLTGWRRITGLVPYSRHANHLHGPDGACSPESKQVSNMAVVLPDLVANGKGEAYGTVNLIVHQRVIGPGYFMVVHAKPTPASQRNQIGSAPASMAFMQAMSNDPAILCGNVEVKS